MIQQIVLSAQQSCDAAHRALLHGEDACARAYAIDQIAELLVRIRTLYPDVDPQDETVARVIRFGFTRHLRAQTTQIQQEIRARVLAEDPAAADALAKQYYDRALAAWFR